MVNVVISARQHPNERPVKALENWSPPTFWLQLFCWQNSVAERTVLFKQHAQCSQPLDPVASDEQWQPHDTGERQKAFP
jgi:hypothetical protein